MAWKGWEGYSGPGAQPQAETRARAPIVRRAPTDIAAQCRLLKLPEPVAEFKFHPVRKWKFDWAWPDLKVALEQEGIVYTADHKLDGRHASRKGFTADIEKYAVAFSLGWRVLRCLPKQVETGQAILWLDPVLRGSV